MSGYCNICGETMCEGHKVESATKPKRKPYPFRAAARLAEKAQAKGESKFQGVPCKHGHDGLRYACNGACVHCNKKEKVCPFRSAYEKLYFVHCKNVDKMNSLQAELNKLKGV